MPFSHQQPPQLSANNPPRMNTPAKADAQMEQEWFFARADGFSFTMVPAGSNPEEQARLNPGTMEIRLMPEGDLLWKAPKHAPQPPSAPPVAAGEVALSDIELAREMYPIPFGMDPTFWYENQTLARAKQIRQHVSAEVARQTEELRRDSERLSALEEISTYSGGGNGGVYSWKTPLDTECFREAIDAAIAATNKGEA
jgi:hypothetical protein